MKLRTIHLRVSDQATGQPTPCRLHVSDANGREFAPFGQSLDFSIHRGEFVGGHIRLSSGRWFSIPGACEIALPPGPLRFQVRKGISHPPIDEIIDIPVGKMALRLALQRTLDSVKPHCLLIDTRCHFLSPHDAALDAAAEDLDVVNLLAEPMESLGLDGKSCKNVPNLNAFSGQTPTLERFGAQVFVNTHNRHPVLGSLGLLNSHRPVFPLTFGGTEGTDDWSLRDWAAQCHRKGGLVVWTEPYRANKLQGGEALALAILGEIDAYELTPDALNLAPWYRLINAGIHLSLVAASGRLDNRRPLGALQTEVLRPLEDGKGEWPDELRRGLSSVTNGPHITEWTRDTMAHSRAWSVVPFGRLELIVNGKVVASDECALVDGLFVSYLERKIDLPAWVGARVVHSAKSFLDDTSPMFAHTRVTWLGEPQIDSDAKGQLREQLIKSRDWVETEGRFEEPKSKAKLLETFDEALRKLEGPLMHE